MTCLGKFILSITIGLFVATSLGADQLRMKNGSLLIGEVIRVAEEEVTFETPFAGKIKIKQENIERITTDEPVTLMMQDGAVYDDKQIISTETAMLVKTEGERSRVFAAADIEMVNPEPWELGDGYDWTGRVSLAIEFEKGNSDTEDWDLKFKTMWQSIYDRYLMDFDLEYEEANGVKKADNWDTLFQYDRYLEPRSPNYRGAKVGFHHDEFADLTLRSVASVHIGRLFIDNEDLKFSAEVGPAWVDENFKVADDDRWPGVLWYVDLSSKFLGHGITTYIDNEGIVRVEDPSDTIINTTIGLRFPMAYGFETGIEAELEYDGGAPDDVKKLDETYTIRLDYTW